MARKQTRKIAVKRTSTKEKAADLPPAAQKSSTMPRISPMLATLVDRPVDGPGWIYEIKWDGYRALAFLKGDKVELRSRNDISFNSKFYPVHRALQKWNLNAVVDGEVVVLNPDGRSDFGSLQNWRSEADGHLIYYVFDLLWLDGRDLRSTPLVERRKLLKTLAPKANTIRLSDTFEIGGTEFFELARNMGLEGIMAKKANSLYDAGARTTSWLKIKANKRQEVVIGGFTRNLGTDKLFSALIVGVYNKGELVYTGKVGTGFNEKLQKDMLAQFKPYITDEVPFSSLPDVNKPTRFNPHPPKATATWLKPKLVCEVSFAEMTSDGVMRHPSFVGMRTDKRPIEVKEEKAVPIKALAGKPQRILTPPTTGRGGLLNPTDETQVKEVAGHAIKFNNLSKIYWPESKVSKRDMLNYYYLVAPYLLPYLKDRPQSLNRFPNGIHGKSFYQKDVTGKVPAWVDTFLYHSSDDHDVDKHFLVPRSEADILLMGSLGCIEMNPWSSRVDKPDRPDWCIIDLDPGKTTFDQVIEAAQVTRKLLDSLGVASYCKTSGSKGLHIYVPLGAQYTYEVSREFARSIVTRVNKELPRYTSIERMVGNRNGKMYLDFLQNRPKATLAAAYSLRPQPHAPVSMPLEWSEVKKGLKIADFNIRNAIDRIKETGDLFKPVLGKGIDLQKIVKKL